MLEPLAPTPTPRSRHCARAASLAIRLLTVVSLALIVFASATPEANAGADDNLHVANVEIGFGGVYKLGCWTQLTVTFDGSDLEDVSGRLDVDVFDTDGVKTTNSTALVVPSTTSSTPIGDRLAASIFIRPGQEFGELTVRFVPEQGEALVRRFTPKEAADAATPGQLAVGMPSTARLAVLYGVGESLVDLFRANDDADPRTVTRAVNLQDAADLPLEWYGYEAVDTVILGGSRPDLYQDLAADSRRMAALGRWVELGGRLIIFCGENAEQLLAEGKPLAPLVPGRFKDMARLSESTPLEAFAGNATPLRRSDLPISVPQLVDVTGAILAFPRQTPGELPLVIRARRGLGEVTFAAVDLDAPPLDVWPGRAPFLRRLLAWRDSPIGSDDVAEGAGQASIRPDLTNHVRAALDSRLAGVTTVSFGFVTLLVGAYIALIGPGDLFLLQRALKRMEATWVTFPLAVIMASVAAYALAKQLKGTENRASQLEIVDCDLSTGVTRGTVVTHIYSPKVVRINATLVPRLGRAELGGKLPSPTGGSNDPRGSFERTSSALSDSPEILATYFGLPGSGLGAMEGPLVETSLFAEGYWYAEGLTSLVGVPIEQWSTKTLLARWTATTPTDRESALLDARLNRLADDLIEGRITNHTGLRLEDGVLLHGKWAYSLPRLADGATHEITRLTQPKTVKTTLAAARAGDDAAPRVAEDGTSLYDPYSADVARLAKLLMFHEALGGATYASTPHRYQQQLDLSRLLSGEQAILLARVSKTAGSRWTISSADAAGEFDAKVESSDFTFNSWTYYRFVIPLTRPQQVVVPTK